MGEPVLLESLREIADTWSLKLGEELPGGGLACRVEATTADGGEVVLKLWPPWAWDADELSALRAWGGCRAPAVLRVDEEAGIVLLERIRPGTPAADADPSDVAEVLRSLHIAPPDGLPSLEAVVWRRLEQAAGRVTAPRLDWAHSALERLLAGAPDPLLLHGSFDATTLVRCARRGLCAVDARPCAGDPAYDAATWIHAGGRPGRRARFEALAAAAGLDRARLRDWCGVIAVHG